MTLYRIRFVYCLTVQANSASAAHEAICKQIKDHPQSVISAIEDARYGKRQPLWKQLVFG